ncbi:MAG: GNAT family N-acetyltransferase [Candidatus Acidiferrum sp.]
MNDARAIRFEPARAEHADIFLAMMRALESADPGTTPFDEQRRRAIFQEFVRDNTYGQAWLILEGDQHVGYVVLTVSFSFEYRGYDAFIDELYIAEEHRGRGIGRRAMQFAEGAARDRGVNAMHLEVSRDNQAALELYRRAGYADHGRYLMTKWLDGGQS